MGIGWSDLDPTKHAKKFANSTEGKFLINPLYGQADEANKRMNPKVPETPQAKEDARIKALRDRTAKDAKSFRANLPKYQEEQFKPLVAESEAQMRQGIDQTRKNYSRRGLLYSGYRMGDEADIQMQRAKTIAEQRADINREAQNIANRKDQQAASVGLEGYESAVDRAEAAYANSQAEALRRRQAFQQLGQGLGYGLGAGAASGKGSV